MGRSAAAVAVSLVLAVSVAPDPVAAAGEPEPGLRIVLREVPESVPASGPVRLRAVVSGIPADAQLGVRLVGGEDPHCVAPERLDEQGSRVRWTCWSTTAALGAHALHGVAVARRGTDVVARAESTAATVTAGDRTAGGLSAREYRRIRGCGGTDGTVQITFDDYGSWGQVSSILSTLRRNRVRGRFFLIGQWAAANPGLVSRIRREGHLVGNHTYSHPNLAAVSNARVLREIRGGVRASRPRLLRPPYGAGGLTPRLLRLARSTGHELCLWTVDTRDWERSTSAGDVVRKVRYGDAEGPRVAAGGVVLMHLHGRHAAAALQGVIDAVKARGLKPEPLPS